MNLEEFYAYCQAKPGVEETFPFGEQTLVFKVMGKLFALTNLESDRFSINLKCEPERAVLLRESHPDDIRPGYHMNKRHWNTVSADGELSDELLRQLIDHSYELVVNGLPKKVRDALR